jgi:hypothetical protein
MEQNMKQLQNSITTMILHTLDERFLEGDIGTEGNHENREENVEKIRIDSKNHNYSSLQDIHQ